MHVSFLPFGFCCMLHVIHVIDQKLVWLSLANLAGPKTGVKLFCWPRFGVSLLGCGLYSLPRMSQ